MKKNKTYFFFIFFITINFQLLAQFQFSKIFSDHCVLQQGKTMPIWGWAAPYTEVELRFLQQDKKVKADSTGKWRVDLEPLKAGGPYEMTAFSKNNSLIIKDIYIGEVWLISGQSNMEWTVAQSVNVEVVKKEADFPLIRHFKIEHDVSMKPEQELKSGEWKIATKKTVVDFSAIGFHTAKALFGTLNVPIGIVDCSWGGSQIESWISKDALAESDEFREYARNLPNTWEAADDAWDKKLRYHFLPHERLFPTIIDESFYSHKDFDFSKWNISDAIGQWDWKGFFAFRGKGFMAKKITLPQSMISLPTTLSLGYNDSETEIYINGELVYFGKNKGKKFIKLPPFTWKSEENTLFVKMGMMQNPEWFGLGIMSEEEDLFIASDYEKVLINSDWYMMPSFAEKHHYVHLSNNSATITYNAMVAPLVPLAMRGIAWYQGESNASRAWQYGKSFPLLINDWRKKWNENLPFHFVQLTSYNAQKHKFGASEWAELRESQANALTLPNTAMIVTYDLGNPDDIHPTNKEDFAQRLFSNILHHTYNEKKDSLYTFFETLEVTENETILTFSNKEIDLKLKKGETVLKGFIMAGEDKIFHSVEAQLIDNKVFIKRHNGKKIVAVRYAWADLPIEANLFNAKDLPVCPFRTDDWEAVTKEMKF